VAEEWSPAELLQAGWNESDLAWERETEAVFVRATTAENARANFVPDDPRLGTALANYGWCLAQFGKSGAGGDLFGEARRVWLKADRWLEGLRAPRVARSSLFHMRMEQRHRAAYEERWRTLWHALADEARGRLAGEAGPVGPEAALERWRRERPAMLNDSRKVMAAAILLLTS
jgi:hypothetical protein